MQKWLSILTLFLLCAASGVAHAAEQATSLDASTFLDPSLPDCGIQRAIDSLGAAGGELKLPAGRIELRRSLMLRSNVTLRGAGTDKTVLTLAGLEVCEPFETVAPNQLRLAHVPASLRVNTAVYAWPVKRAGIFRGAIVPCLVTAIDGNLVTLDQPIRKYKEGILSFGQSTLLLESCLKDTIKLKVADPSLFRVGGALAIGTADGNANESLTFIKSIDGNTLTFERPILIAHPLDVEARKRPAAWALFPLITAENVKHVTIADMALEHPFTVDTRPLLSRYTVSPIHLFNASDSLIQNVLVRNSCADGISLQMGSRVTVRNCQVINCSGNGFHPGTALRESLFEDCLAQNNGSGFYFCWENQGHIVRHNKFLSNGTGMSGLGCPADIKNTIEDNLIADNRAVGIHIIGGKVSDNIIRNNTFRNNSAGTAGKYPAILLEALVEDARAYTIEGNTFENTTTPALQSAGVEERNGMYKKLPTSANQNTIRANIFRNMAIADVIYVGDKTIVDQPGAKIILTDKTKPIQPANQRDIEIPDTAKP